LPGYWKLKDFPACKAADMARRIGKEFLTISTSSHFGPSGSLSILGKKPTPNL
jgi:hypothetical protein